jgi:hypothetical protein
MKSVVGKIFILLALAVGGLPYSPVWALYPFQGYNNLVAGEGTTGWKDGPFYQARFNQPEGLALNAEGTLLYVADRGNNLIRVVDLAHANAVTTLAGFQEAGSQAVSLSLARFDQPALLIRLPDGRLAVDEEGTGRIRALDFKNHSVGTLAGTGDSGFRDGPAGEAQAGGIGGMALREGENALYFTQPSFGTLRRLDLARGQVSTILKDDPRIPHPSALCSHAGMFYAADQETGKVFKLSFPPHEPLKSGEVVLEPVYLGKNIQALEWSGSTLYALQGDAQAPLVRVLPATEAVTFVSVWGFPQDPVRDAFFGDTGSLSPQGLLADPRSPGHFFLSHFSQNLLTDFRDYRQMKLLNTDDVHNSNGLTEFEYPVEKAPGTYRILLIGDSRTFHMIEEDKKIWGIYNRMGIMAKRLELELNSWAAMEDIPVHYEVLDQSELGWAPLFLWPYHRVLPTVTKFDIDLVLMVVNNFFDSFDLNLYFQRPLDGAGVPVDHDNPEYLLESWKTKLHRDDLRYFANFCLGKKRAYAQGDQYRFASTSSLLEDPVTRKEAVKFYSRPMKLFYEKLKSLKTGGGKPVSMQICFLPTGSPGPLGDKMEIGNEIFGEMGIPVLDLYPLMTASRVTFYPMSEMSGYDHFNSHGHDWVSFMLAHELIHRRLIPMGP